MLRKVNRMGEALKNPATATANDYTDDNDGSCCSTPFVSAPSSPGRETNTVPISIPGFYFSAPASPVHFVLSKTINSIDSRPSAPDANASFDFDFSASLPPTAAPSPDSMTSADELFLNGQIRPMKLSTHLQRPQLLPPLIEPDNDVLKEDPLTSARGRELRNFRAGSLRRRTRSMSPSRNSTTTPFDWVTNESEISRGKNIINNSLVDAKDKKTETTPSRSSSKRWVLLKELLLYRSKSEGRNKEGHNKFWGSLSFSPVAKDRKVITRAMKEESKSKNKNRDGKKRVISAHELHYNEKRAQAEEMRKRTFLPYRQGLLGACLGLTSKSYGAMNGFATALNSVSSR